MHAGTQLSNLYLSQPTSPTQRDFTPSPHPCPPPCSERFLRPRQQRQQQPCPPALLAAQSTECSVSAPWIVIVFWDVFWIPAIVKMVLTALLRTSWKPFSLWVNQLNLLPVLRQLQTAPDAPFISTNLALLNIRSPGNKLFLYILYLFSYLSMLPKLYFFTIYRQFGLLLVYLGH